MKRYVLVFFNLKNIPYWKILKALTKKKKKIEYIKFSQKYKRII